MMYKYDVGQEHGAMNVRPSLTVQGKSLASPLTPDPKLPKEVSKKMPMACKLFLCFRS